MKKLKYQIIHEFETKEDREAFSRFITKARMKNGMLTTVCKKTFSYWFEPENSMKIKEENRRSRK